MTAIAGEFAWRSTPCAECGHSGHSHAVGEAGTLGLELHPCLVRRCDCNAFTLRPAATPAVPVDDPVNHPSHYTSHPSGVECITITEHMSFNVGNAMKYLWRADDKGAPIEDLEKAGWYIAREVAKRKKLES